MSYLQQWENMFADAHAQQQNAELINRYYQLETLAYKQVLAAKQAKLEGTFNELAKQLGFGEEKVIFMGFLDGLNPCLNTQLDLATVDDNTDLNLEINFTELFLAMRRVKAKWLYELPEWADVLSDEERQALVEQWRSEVTRTHEKVGRNEPCTCGSGKKYKKCCGK